MTGRSDTNLKTNLYTLGKFGKSLRETLDTTSGQLYDRGKMKAKITVNDLTPDFVKIHCKAIWYMDGFLKLSTIRHISYEPSHLNHLLKDDSLYISYSGLIRKEVEGAFTTYKGYDFILSGNDIIHVLNALEEYGQTNIKPELQKAKAAVSKKIEWFRSTYPEDYKRIFNTDELIDIFKHESYK